MLCPVSHDPNIMTIAAKVTKVNPLYRERTRTSPSPLDWIPEVRAPSASAAEQIHRPILMVIVASGEQAASRANTTSRASGQTVQSQHRVQVRLVSAAKHRAGLRVLEIKI
jgi:hypothetical protein